MSQLESVPSIAETAATGEVADIYADIRATLGTSVVNLVWRNLATIPGALRWSWSAVRPLYAGPAHLHAETVRRTLRLPEVPPFSVDAMTAAGMDRAALISIHTILDSYYHTNALALVALSALLERHDPRATDPAHPSDSVPAADRTELPVLPQMATLAADVQRLIEELNTFGEDTESRLIASMYRHLAYWPPYLAMIRTLLAPLQVDGQLMRLTEAARALGRAHGRVLANQLAPDRPPAALEEALATCRLFVEHPIARMTGICATIRQATPG